MNFRYAIFDMDGTLLDSIPYWARLATSYLKDCGVENPEGVDEKIALMSMDEAAAFMKNEYGLEKTAEQICKEICDRIAKNYAEDIGMKPGAAAFLEDLHQKGVRMCLATASSVELGRPALKRNGLLQYFEFMLDCGMTRVGKTSPDIYLMAAGRFGARPEECAVIEDASFALRTASKAGFWTIGVYEASEADKDMVQRYSNRYIHSFDELLSGGRSLWV